MIKEQKTYCIIDSKQLVDVVIVKEKKSWLGDKVLVTFKQQIYRNGDYLYTEQRAKWIRKRNLLNTKNRKE